MKELYRMRSLARLGVAVLAAVGCWMLVALIIPKYPTPAVHSQLYTIRHQELRDNNPLYTDMFLRSIKQNEGYLVLGTSETNELPYANYFDYLNTDSSLDAHFSVIGGAGRTACTYFPLLQSNSNVENLNIIYYINPAYWCNKLAKSNADYFPRYVSSYVYKQANHPKNQDVDHVLRVNLPNVRWSDRVVAPLSYYAELFRRKYYQDLAFRLDSTKLYSNLTWLSVDAVMRKPQHSSRPDSSRYNYDLNVSADFDVSSYTLHTQPEEPYRYDELTTMVRLCRLRKVHVLFVVGPYNRIAFERVHPEEVAKMEQVTENVKRLLEKEGAAYIDCSDISGEPGAFADWQHHSGYGAFLIYQKIREYVLEKESH